MRMTDIHGAAGMVDSRTMSGQPSSEPRLVNIIELAARITHLENCEAARCQREIEEKVERREFRNILETVAIFAMWCANQLRWGPMTEAERVYLECAKETRIARGVQPMTLNEVPRPPAFIGRPMSKAPGLERPIRGAEVEPFVRRDPPPVNPDDDGTKPAA
jgi:hypothetical protein